MNERGDRLAKTYVWHGERCFFVSTADRDSSALAAGDVRYAETLVWEYDWSTGERGKIVAQASCAPGSITTHLIVVESLNRTGKYDDL
jgi:hypothetical protein